MNHSNVKVVAQADQNPPFSGLLLRAAVTDKVPSAGLKTQIKLSAKCLLVPFGALPSPQCLPTMALNTPAFGTKHTALQGTGLPAAFWEVSPRQSVLNQERSTFLTNACPKRRQGYSGQAWACRKCGSGIRVEASQGWGLTAAGPRPVTAG